MRIKHIHNIINTVFVFLFVSYACITTVTASETDSVVAKATSSYMLTKQQADSLIDAIPKDTTSFIVLRDFNVVLTDKYSSDRSFDYERNVNKSILQRLEEMISSFLYRYLKIPDSWKNSDLSDKIVKILLVLIFILSLYFLVRVFMNHKGRWFFEKKDEEVSVDFSNVEKYIHKADFPALLAQAESDGNTRQSIRILYLWVLKVLSDRGVVQWSVDKTNVDYLTEIEDQVLQNQFRYLSYLYNYIWYGKFSIRDTEYNDAKKVFLRHIKSNSE